jgi:hypothetical protein
MLRHRRRGREGTLVPRSLTLEEQSPLFFMWCRNARCLLFRSWPGRYAGPEQRRVTSSTKHFNIQHHSAQYQCHPFALVYRGHVFNRNSILSPQMFRLLSTISQCWFVFVQLEVFAAGSAQYEFKISIFILTSIPQVTQLHILVLSFIVQMYPCLLS